jgi:hypothetical protein
MKFILLLINETDEAAHRKIERKSCILKRIDEIVSVR